MTPTPCKVQFFSFEQREVSVDVDKAILIEYIVVQYFDSFTSQVYDNNVRFLLHEYAEE